MLIRASARFQRQYFCAPGKRDAPVQPFPQTWNVDILPNGRSQLVILASEEYSLFSFLIPASRERHIDSFLIPFRTRLVQLFEKILFEQQPDITQITFSNRTNRRVIGSQNDLLYLTQQALKDSGKPASLNTLQKTEKWLNSTPMSYLNMDSPSQALSKQVEKLKHGSR